MSIKRINYCIKHEEEAYARNLILIDHCLTTPILKLYKFAECGHEQLIQPGHVRDNRFRCKVCYENERIKLLNLNGLEILDQRPSKDSNKKLIKFLNCGHTRTVNLQAAKDNEVFCKICQISRIKDAAAIVGLLFLRRCNYDNRYAIYQLQCGHEKRTQIGNANKGVYKCSICNSSYIDQKSSVYLLKIKTKYNEILKIGFAANVNSRVKQLQFDGSVIDILTVKYFETGKQAESFEQKLHKLFKTSRLNKEEVKFIIRTGWTECYSIDILEDILPLLK